METLLIYLVSASAGISLFYMVYWMFLKYETFHQANRLYMLATLLAAVFIPLFPIQYTVLVENNLSPISTTSVADTFKGLPVIGESGFSETFSWLKVIVIIYVTGALLFLLRILIQSFTLVHIIIGQQIRKLDGMRVVENEKYSLPFSFFNIVFINLKSHTQDELPEILAHEKVHIRENHWFDLLIIELLTVIFWFNPFIWLFERSIKQNHEYLADKGVLAQGHTLGRYQALLVNQLMGVQVIGITNNLKFALNANRLKMMTKKKTSPLKGLKFVWALPVLALLLFAFAEPQYKQEEALSPGIPISTEETPVKTVKVAGVVIDQNGDAMPGTSIVVKGSTVGTVVDRDGTFSLEVPENADLVFSYVGKKTMFISYAELISGTPKDGAFTGKYTLEDAVQVLYNPNYSGEQMIPPPPPPPPANKTEKLVKKDEKSDDVPPPPPPAKTEKEVFYIVEDMPKYPGGFGALQENVEMMQKKLARENNMKGKATVSFTINPKGKVSDINIVEKDNDQAAKGAYVIASKLPDWTPGYQRGKAVPVKYLLPLEFK